MWFLFGFLALMGFFILLAFLFPDTFQSEREAVEWDRQRRKKIELEQQLQRQKELQLKRQRHEDNSINNPKHNRPRLGIKCFKFGARIRKC